MTNAKDVLEWMERQEKRKPMTNEEYLHLLNTEQLAEAIFRICERATWDYNVKIMVAEKKKDLIVEWLKQPHTIKEIHE